MIDQERRESIITDIKNILCNACCEEPCSIACECVLSEASTICDYILRKEEEARKETAKRIEVELLRTYRKALLKTKGWKDWFEQEFGVIVSDEELFN